MIEELTVYDFKDRVQIPEGYEYISVPDITRDNFQVLIDSHNELVNAFNELKGDL